MPTPEEEAAAAAAAKAASDKAAADAAAAAEAAKIAADAEAAAAAAKSEQTVPLARLQAVIGQRAEEARANEALRRELKLANDTLEEFRQLGKKTGDDGATRTQQAQTGTSANGKALSPAELRALVSQEAEKQNFDQRCNSAVTAGRAAHTDFDKVVLGDLMSVSPVIDQQSGRPVLPIPMLEAALETGNAHEVLYALGQNVSEASRIMALRPVAQAVELTKFAAKLAAASTQTEESETGEARVSRAPAPIKAPTKAGGAKPAFTVYDTENFSTEDWIRQREKQVAEQRQAARR